MSSQGNPLHDGRLFIPQLPYGASGNVHTYDNYNMHKDLLIHGNAHLMTDLAVDRNVYIAGNLHVAGNMTEVTLNNTITDDLIITVGGNNINNTNYRGVEMGYATGNAFFGYNPNSTLFELYSDIGESIPSDNNFDSNVTTKGTLQCEIHGNVTGNLVGNVTGELTGNVTGNLVGDVIGDLISLNSGGVVKFNNSNNSAYASISFNETENKIQLQRGLIPSVDKYWDIGNSAVRINNIYSDTFTGNVTGNITGELTGNVTGNVTGDIIGDTDVYGNMLFRIGYFGTTQSDETLTSHPTGSIDGVFYRLNGQFHLMVDDNFYITDDSTSGATAGGQFHFDTTNGIFKSSGSISSNQGFLSFTGIHKINESYNEYGLILESTGVVDKTDNLNTIVETQLCSTNKSKKVYGVSLNGNTNGAVSLGEATMLVTNFGGDIMNGDYICSSEITGYGMLQDDDLLHNYTVAKSTEDIDWNNVTDTIEHNGQTYKKVLIAVTLHCG